MKQDIAVMKKKTNLKHKILQDLNQGGIEGRIRAQTKARIALYMTHKPNQF